MLWEKQPQPLVKLEYEVYKGRDEMLSFNTATLQSSSQAGPKMYPIFTASVAIAVIGYLVLQVLLHATQDKKEPPLVESSLPFLDPAMGIAIHRASYLVRLGYD
jgi:hypothetical protein